MLCQPCLGTRRWLGEADLNAAQVEMIIFYLEKGVACLLTDGTAMSHQAEDRNKPGPETKWFEKNEGRHLKAVHGLSLNFEIAHATVRRKLNLLS